MSLVRLGIKGISNSQTHSGAYALILSEIKGERKLPIVIGSFEAQSIAVALEKEIRPPRPLTHDLFKNFANRFDIIVKKVIIHKLVDGVFYSSLICERDGIEEIIDARTSDAVALAIRFRAPIFTYQNILDKAGILLSTSSSVEQKKKDPGLMIEQIQKLLSHELTKDHSKTLSDMPLEELKKQLTDAVINEDYETAAKIRDEIAKR